MSALLQNCFQCVVGLSKQRCQIYSRKEAQKSTQFIDSLDFCVLVCSFLSVN